MLFPQSGPRMVFPNLHLPIPARLKSLPQTQPIPGSWRGACSDGQFFAGFLCSLPPARPSLGFLVPTSSPGPCQTALGSAATVILSNLTSEHASPALNPPILPQQGPQKACPLLPSLFLMSQPSFALLQPHPLTCRLRPLQTPSCHWAFARAVLGFECSFPLLHLNTAHPSPCSTVTIPSEFEGYLNNACLSHLTVGLGVLVGDKVLEVTNAPNLVDCR